MTTKIENAKHVFFEDKEHYLAFKKAWASVERSSHEHVLYNLLRGYSIHRGFTPTSRPAKLANGHRINGGLYEAVTSLKRITESAKKIVGGKLSSFITINGKRQSWDQKTVDDALATWDGTLTVQMLASLDEHIPKVTPLFSDFGKGIALAAALSVIHRLVNESKPLDPDFAKVVDEEFWTLLREPKDLDDKATSVLYDNLWELYI